MNKTYLKQFLNTDAAINVVLHDGRTSTGTLVLIDGTYKVRTGQRGRPLTFDVTDVAEVNVPKVRKTAAKTVAKSTPVRKPVVKAAPAKVVAKAKVIKSAPVKTAPKVVAKKAPAKVAAPKAKTVTKPVRRLKSVA